MNVQKGIYQHFKGETYEVLGQVKHSETLEDLVLYKRISETQLWVRPIDMFTEIIERDGRTVERFRFIKPN